MSSNPNFSGQIPLHYDIVGADGKMNQQWAFWFQQFINNLPPSGTSFVVNGDNISQPPSQTLFQGPDSEKG